MKGIYVSLKSILKFLLANFRISIKKISKNNIHFSSYIGGTVLMRNCMVGKHCYIASQSILNNVEIGNYTCIAPHVQIGGMQHAYWYPSISPKLSTECIRKKTTLGNDVWIAAGAIIAQGVTIGNGAVVGANSFVNTDVPPYAIVVGSPARILKYRFDDDIIKELENSEFWNKDLDEARSLVAKFNKMYIRK